MVRRNDLSVYIVFSLILHSLFVFSMWGWMRSLADARPSNDIIKVSIVQAPLMRAMAAPAASSKPKTVSLAQPVPLEKIMTQAKKASEPVLEDPPLTVPAQDGATGTGTAMPIGVPVGQGQSTAESAATEARLNADKVLANARDAYATELYHIIRKYFVYPALARRRGQEGRVQVSFVVGDDGRAQDLAVVASSGFSLLDRAAVETIQKIPLPTPPRRAMQIPITIVYRLEEGD